jgi:peptidoglycan-N-acetylglucosamine deacetylase
VENKSALENHFHFTIDLEDWFHILDHRSAELDNWDRLENRIEKNTGLLLEMMDKYNIKATFFVIGWIARKYPRLIKLIDSSGHELASHSLSHQLLYRLDEKELLREIRDSKSTIEEISGKEVIGFRAPGFSIREGNRHVLDLLCEEGYKYDSSIFLGWHAHGGGGAEIDGPQFITTPQNGTIFEFPIAPVYLLKVRIPFSGGGYLRTLPLIIFRYFVKSGFKQNKNIVFYVHPREVDQSQPRIESLSIYRKFSYYYGISSTFPKLEFLFRNYKFKSLKEIYHSMEPLEFQGENKMPI